MVVKVKGASKGTSLWPLRVRGGQGDLAVTVESEGQARVLAVDVESEWRAKVPSC